jgi:hypothetical protein
MFFMEGAHKYSKLQAQGGDLTAYQCTLLLSILLFQRQFHCSTFCYLGRRLMLSIPQSGQDVSARHFAVWAADAPPSNSTVLCEVDGECVQKRDGEGMPKPSTFCATVG